MKSRQTEELNRFGFAEQGEAAQTAMLSEQGQRSGERGSAYERMDEGIQRQVLPCEVFYG